MHNLYYLLERYPLWGYTDVKETGMQDHVYLPTLSEVSGEQVAGALPPGAQLLTCQVRAKQGQLTRSLRAPGDCLDRKSVGVDEWAWTSPPPHLRHRASR